MSIEVSNSYDRSEPQPVTHKSALERNTGLALDDLGKPCLVVIQDWSPEDGTLVNVYSLSGGKSNRYFSQESGELSPRAFDQNCESAGLVWAPDGFELTLIQKPAGE